MNRKNFHSIVLQGVCTSDLKFIDCYAGEVGSVHDARVFARSDLHGRMLNEPNLFPHDSHIVGDAAYPLMKHVMTPYKENGNLTVKQRKFNTSLSSARSVIERAFAHLKGRFRRLKYLEMNRTDLIPKYIIACCILHNICIDNDDAFEASGDDFDSTTDLSRHADGENVRLSAADRQFAVAKRNCIADDL